MELLFSLAVAESRSLEVGSELSAISFQLGWGGVRGEFGRGSGWVWGWVGIARLFVFSDLGMR